MPRITFSPIQSECWCEHDHPGAHISQLSGPRFATPPPLHQLNLHTLWHFSSLSLSGQNAHNTVWGSWSTPKKVTLDELKVPLKLDSVQQSVVDHFQWPLGVSTLPVSCHRAAYIESLQALTETLFSCLLDIAPELVVPEYCYLLPSLLNSN